jgi:hypothetical protein
LVIFLCTSKTLQLPGKVNILGKIFHRTTNEKGFLGAEFDNVIYENERKSINFTCVPSGMRRKKQHNSFSLHPQDGAAEENLPKIPKTLRSPSSENSFLPSPLPIPL